MAWYEFDIGKAIDSGLGAWNNHEDVKLQREIKAQEAEANAWWNVFSGGSGTPTQPGNGTKKPSPPTDWVMVSAVIGVIGLIITAAGLLMKSK